MRIIFDEDVEQYLNGLVDILHKKEYFGLKSSAYDYVGWIIDNIEKKIAKMPCKIAPSYFERYGKGMYYAAFKRNRNTSWYVFFNVYQTQEETVYFVRHISNNHTIAQHL